jgi:hypothetical protein
MNRSQRAVGAMASRAAIATRARPTYTVTALGSAWTPARDSFRYFGGRIDVSF